MPLALLAAVLCQAPAPAPAPQARIVWDSKDFDFGSIYPDTTISHRFKITNAGSAPLRIIRVTPTCGCTSTVVGKGTLAPGETTEIEAIFNATGLAGPIRKAIRVLTNDPANRTQTLTLMAQVRRYILPSTETVTFQDLVRTLPRTASVKLTSNTGEPIVVADVELSEAPWLGVATREDGHDVWVDFNLVGRRIPPGKMSGTDTISVHATNPRPSNVNLTVRWDLRASVAALPARVAWAEPAGRELRQTVTLRQVDGKAFRILSATASPAGLSTEGIPAGPASSHDIQAILSAKTQPGLFQGKITLALDDPDQPELEIRVAAALDSPK
jgi:hypothetical protein